MRFFKLQFFSTRGDLTAKPKFSCFERMLILMLTTFLLCACHHKRPPASQGLLQQNVFYSVYHGLVAGNPRGRFTIVEFFDYRCHACADGFAAMQQIIQDDPFVRVIYRVVPFLGPDSTFAARAALASVFQNKYVAYHDALMAVGPALDQDAIWFIAKKIGLHRSKLKKEMSSHFVKAQLLQNRYLASKLGVEGTPVYLVAQTNWHNGQLQVGQAVELEGTQSFDQLKNAVIALND